MSFINKFIDKAKGSSRQQPPSPQPDTQQMHKTTSSSGQNSVTASSSYRTDVTMVTTSSQQTDVTLVQSSSRQDEQDLEGKY
jgi:hypothetical protein